MQNHPILSSIIAGLNPARAASAVKRHVWSKKAIEEAAASEDTDVDYDAKKFPLTEAFKKPFRAFKNRRKAQLRDKDRGNNINLSV